MAPQLKHVFNIRVHLDDAKMVMLPSEFGTRTLEMVESGTFKSHVESLPIEGTILPHVSGDFGVASASLKSFHLTAQLVIKITNPNPEDKEYIFMKYTGVYGLEQALKRRAASSEEREKMDRPYLVTRPSFEVTSERLKWMEHAVFIGNGYLHAVDDGSEDLEYRIYQVIHCQDKP